MRMALGLAERGRGTTRPNPLVGAVIVNRGDVVGRGFHKRAGGPHAEIEALMPAGARARGGTLYVTLEPCCHQGRTGPCTEAVIAAGIKKVIVACRDPNPLVNGRGLKHLRRAGIEVSVGVLEAEARIQNRGFIRWISDGRPHVTLKTATTLDGFTAPPSYKKGQIHWITSEPARAYVHQMRAAHDAVLVGVGTVEADDPQLTVRRGKKITGPQPRRVVLDTDLRTPVKAQLFRNANPRVAGPLLIGAIPGSSKKTAVTKRQATLERAGAEVLLLEPGRDGRVTIRRILDALAERDLHAVLVEGGNQVHGAFIAAGLVDEVAFFVAPKLFGAGAPIASKGMRTGWTGGLALKGIEVKAIGPDLLVTGLVKRP
jgi:diaminohydroxyphosphoribosylaminopyrimidine deaminase/5-amino-6-(5-phosphoribosylamino)uracil reductase